MSLKSGRRVCGFVLHIQNPLMKSIYGVLGNVLRRLEEAVGFAPYL